jgi:hypothetical protein
MHKKYKRLWAFSSVLLLTFNILISLALTIPQEAKAADNAFNWRAADNTTTNSGSFAANRFEFVTPLRIRDTATDTVYASGNSNVFNNGGSEYFRNGGWFYYWPQDKVRGKTSAGECIDPLAVRVSQPDDKLEVYAINVSKVGDSCIIQGMNNADYDGSGEDKDPPDEYEDHISDRFTNAASSRFSVSMWRWENSNNLQGYGKNKDLQRIGDPYDEILKGIIEDEADFVYDNFIYYSHPDCYADNRFVRAFMAVSKNTSDKHVGYMWHDNGTDGNKGTLSDSWRGDGFTCMTSENWTKNPTNLSLTRNAASGGAGISRMYLASPQNATQDGEPPEDTGGGGGGGGEDEAAEDDSCESAGDFAWALCPIIYAVSTAIEWTTTQVSRLLEADRDNYTNEKLYEGWANIRNIALSLLIVLMLVMVIATALDLQAFDAYTVKRALPRMVAATMFIVLSWYICVLLIDIFNALGSGALGIMTSPFSDTGLPMTEVFDNGGIAQAMTQWVGAIAGAIGILLILVFFGSTILLFVGLAFFVLILRQLFILALMLLAPLAILAWIFPGNDKLWKLWWGSFSKLLMMYPLIMMLLGAGRIFAYLVGSVDDSAGIEVAIEPLLKLLAFTAPFAAIPMTFKFAGGLFATISGMANDRSKGLFDRASKRRQAKAQRWAGGNAFKGAPDGSFRNKFNRGVQTAANAKHYGGLSSLRHPSQIGSNIRSAVGEREFEHAMEAAEKLPGAKAFFASDDLMLAGLEGGGDRQKTMNYLRGLTTTDANGRRVAKYSGVALDNMTNQVMRMRSQMGNDSFNIAALAKAPATGTAFVGEEAGKWHQMIAKATHGDGSLAASIVAQGKAGFKSAQRYEVSEAGFGDHMQAISMAGDDTVSASDISNFIADKAYAGGGAGAVVAARNDSSARMFAGAIKRDIAKGKAESLATGESRHLTRALSAASAVHDQVGQAKRIVSDVLSNEVFAAGSGIGAGENGGQELTVVQAFDQAKQDDPDTWVEGKKEFRSEIGDQAAAAAAARQQNGGGAAPPPIAPGPGVGL